MKSTSGSNSKKQLTVRNVDLEEDGEEEVVQRPKLSTLLTYFENLEAAIDRIEKRLTTVEGRCAQFQAYIRRNTTAITAKSSSPVLQPAKNQATSSKSPKASSSKHFEGSIDLASDDEISEVGVIVGKQSQGEPIDNNIPDKKHKESPKGDVEPAIFQGIVEELTSTLLESNSSTDTQASKESPLTEGRATRTRAAKATKPSQPAKTAPKPSTKKKATTKTAQPVIVTENLPTAKKSGPKRVTRRRSKSHGVPKNSISVLDIIEDEDESESESESDASCGSSESLPEEDDLTPSSEDDAMEDANQRMARRTAQRLAKSQSTSDRPRRPSRHTKTKQEEDTPSKLKRKAAVAVNYLETSSEEEEFHTDTEAGGEKTASSAPNKSAIIKRKKGDAVPSKPAESDDLIPLKSEIQLAVSKAVPTADPTELECRRPNVVEKKMLSITRSACYMCRYYHHKAVPNTCNLMCTGCTNRFGFQLTICNEEACWEQHLLHICNEPVNAITKKTELQDIINHHYYSRFNIAQFDFASLKHTSEIEAVPTDIAAIIGDTAVDTSNASTAVDAAVEMDVEVEKVETSDSTSSNTNATEEPTSRKRLLRLGGIRLIRSSATTPVLTAEEVVLSDDKISPLSTAVEEDSASSNKVHNKDSDSNREDKSSSSSQSDETVLTRGKRGRRRPSSGATSVAESPMLTVEEVVEPQPTASQPVSKNTTPTRSKRTRR